MRRIFIYFVVSNTTALALSTLTAISSKRRTAFLTLCNSVESEVEQHLEDLFFEEELAKVLKGLKNNKAPGAHTVVNEFLEYSGSKVRNKLLKIMNMIFEKRKYLLILGKP